MDTGIVFLSYRRADSAQMASFLGAALKERIGPERVFLDTEDLAPGASFVDSLRRAVEACDVMLVLIGPQWVTTDRDGRAAGPGEFVREEIVTALRMGKRVVPVLIDDTPFPSTDDLPPDLHPLLRIQGIRLRHARLEEDLAGLFELFGAGDARGAPVAAAPKTSFGALSWLIEKFTRPSPTLEPSSKPIPSPLVLPNPEPGPSRAPSVSTASTHSVFISHSSEDRARVGEVLQAMELAGIRCWVSFRDLADGEPSWAGAIVGAIANSALMVVVVSKHAIGSRQVLREVTIADSENIPFLPYCIDATPLSNDFKYFFSAGQRLDAADIDRGDALARLVAAVRSRASLGGVRPAT